MKAPASRNMPPDEGPLPTYAEFREKLRRREEKRYLAAVLERAEGDMGRACTLAALSRSRLYALLKEHDLTR